jgi:Xaa-Pro aminopeptidase
MTKVTDRILGTPRRSFAERRTRVLESLERAVMLLPAAPLRFGSRDTECPYRPDSDLFYVTGCTEPDSVAVLAPEAEDGPFVLFIRPKNIEAERWSGARLGPEGAKELFGADAVYPIAELEDRLGDLLKAGRRAYYRLGAWERTDVAIRAALAHARGKGPRTGSGLRVIDDPGSVLDELRIRKDEHEIECIRAAAADAVEAFRQAIARVAPGRGEWEVQAAMDGAFRAAGATGPAFETIVGSGANGCVLHYVTNDRRIEAGDLVLIDAGARRDMYCTDITRTVPADGVFTSIQRAVYEIVECARAATVEAVTPGSTTEDLHEASTRVMTNGLVELGVLDGDVEQLIESEAYRPYFPHQTSHWLGLDVHDVGDYMTDRRPRRLEPGMVLTVEPGLYFHPDATGDRVPEELIGIGIRLEDDVLVTAQGPEVLTGTLPSAPDEVLKFMG